MHKAHHADSHQLIFELGLELAVIVLLDRCGDQLWLLSRPHRCRFEILDGCEVSLLLDLDADVIIEPEDQEVGDHVDDAHGEKNVGVVKRYALRYLHHTKDDDQVGSSSLSVLIIPRADEKSHIHRWIDSHSEKLEYDNAKIEFRVGDCDEW